MCKIVFCFIKLFAHDCGRVELGYTVTLYWAILYLNIELWWVHIHTVRANALVPRDNISSTYFITLRRQGY